MKGLKPNIIVGKKVAVGTGFEDEEAKSFEPVGEDNGDETEKDEEELTPVDSKSA